MSKIYGLVGHPVGHSFSPAMHNAAFQSLGMEAEYRLYDIAPDGLEQFIRTAKARGIYGFNVTIPHKVAVWRFLKEHGGLDGEAERLGAVNTVSADGDRPRGFNTDGAGFIRSLEEDLGFDPTAKHIMFIGAGGAARALIMSLGNRPHGIYVTDIDAKKSEEIRTQYAGSFDARRFRVFPSSDLKRIVTVCELLVNATPVGMKADDPSPVDNGYFHRNLIVYDLVYNRPETRLVREAGEKGIRAVTGLGMLLFQGAATFEIWTGMRPPIDIMREALNREIKRC